MATSASPSDPPLVLATANRAKGRELAELLAGLPYRIRDLSEFPTVVLPSEGEQSYAENALAKARTVTAATGLVGGTPILDLDYSEDSTADVDMNIVMTGAGRFVEVQGTAEQTPFDLAQLEALLGLARAGIERLLALQRRVVAERTTTVFTLP